MSEELDRYDAFEQRMTEEYPAMFAQPYGGIACGEGWWPILEALCGEIQSHINWQQQQEKKFGLIKGCEQVVVRQIKEKFGGLRFYYDGGDEVVDGMVRMAESWAARSCETCGAPGTRGGRGWIQTLCAAHRAEADAAYAERV